MSEAKKPSLKDAGNKGLYGYLQHFAQDKFIQAGHNDVDDQPPPLSEGRRSNEYPPVKKGEEEDPNYQKEDLNAMKASEENEKDIRTLLKPGEKLRNP